MRAIISSSSFLRSSRYCSSLISCSRDMICTAASRWNTFLIICAILLSMPRISSRSAAILARTVSVTVLPSTAHSAPSRCGFADGICPTSDSLSHAAYFSGARMKSSASVGQLTATSTLTPFFLPNIAVSPARRAAYCSLRSTSVA